MELLRCVVEVALGLPSAAAPLVEAASMTSLCARPALPSSSVCEQQRPLRLLAAVHALWLTVGSQARLAQELGEVRRQLEHAHTQVQQQLLAAALS